MSRQDIKNAAPWRIEELKGLATKLGATQAILFTHSQEAGTSVDTWGVDAERSAQAAHGANVIKKGWGWPEDTLVESAKVKELRDENAELRRRLAALSPTEVIIHYIEGTEFTRGWGCRPDGYVAFLTKEDAMDWITEYNAKFNNTPTAPDEYTSYSYVGTMKAGPDTSRRFTMTKYVHARRLKEFST